MIQRQKLSITLAAMAIALFGFSTEAQLSEQNEVSAPDLIMVNGDIYTSDPARNKIQAFAVKNGKFSAIGTNEQIKALANEETHIIDAQGNTVTPGFIDGHTHVSGNSPYVAGVDISYVAEKSDWLKMIAEVDKRLPKGEWMTGGGWDHTLTDGIYPTKQMLDEVSPERPIMLNHVDGHYAWVNSLALELAGVTANSPTPPGGEVMVDPKTGETTGILLEGAQSLVGSIIPDRSDEQRQEGLAKMYNYANSFGITGLHQMGGIDDYLRLVENGDPTIRVWYGSFAPFGDMTAFDIGLRDILAKKKQVTERVTASKKEDEVGPLLNLGYVKLMNDGVLSAHTAVLTEDYSDREGWSGEFMLSPEEIKQKIIKVTAAGLPVAVHSIGDAAVTATLDAFEAAKSNAVPFPNRVEHIEMIQTEDIQRFRKLGVVASMQPNHGTNSLAYLSVRVGEHREARAYNWKSMLDAGVTIVFGSDYATSPLSPLVQIADAVFRVSPFGFNDGKPFHPEQIVSFEEALTAYTQAGANMTPWKDEIGSITVGKWADFVILDGAVPTPMNVSFRELAVDATYFAGREIYSKSN